MQPVIFNFDAPYFVGIFHVSNHRRNHTRPDFSIAGACCTAAAVHHVSESFGFRPFDSEECLSMFPWGIHVAYRREPVFAAELGANILDIDDLPGTHSWRHQCLAFGFDEDCVALIENSFGNVSGFRLVFHGHSHADLLGRA